MVRGLRKVDRLTLVTFGSDVRIHHDAEAMTPEGRERILTSLENLQAEGCTNLSGGFQSAGEILLATDEQSGRRRHMILLSDGHANRGIIDRLELGFMAAELLERGVTTSCVGIGDGYCTTQLAALAERGGGELHDAEMPEEIVEVVLGELDYLGDVVAEGIELVVDIPPGMTARDLSGRDSMLRGNTLRCSLGQLNGGASRTVVIRLDLSPMPAGQTVNLGSYLSWKAPGQVQERARIECCAQLKAVDYSEMRASLADAREVLHQWESGLVRQATELNRAGNYEAIQALAREEGREFMQYADQHPETRGSQERIEHMLWYMLSPRDERNRKDLYTLASKAAKGVVDHRKGRENKWYEFLKD